VPEEPNRRPIAGAIFWSDMNLNFLALKMAQIPALAALAVASIATSPALADTPTAVMSGPNSGSADSFQGPHDWYFQTNKGSFDVEITSMGDGHDTVPLNSAFTYRISFSPHIGPHAYTYKQGPDGFSFHGTALQKTKVVVRIIPARSTLVRVARNYTIEVTGSAIAYGGSGVDPIVGTYMDMSHGHGAAHFNPDGSIIFADGTQGKWTAFDPTLRIYTVTAGTDRASVKFVPGRGLLDQAGGGNSLYDTAH
jgi:hypothetical protein